MRLRGDYLAIVTLAFGEILKNLINNMYVGSDANGVHFVIGTEKPLLAEGGSMVINGPMGATGVTKLATFPIGFALILVTLFVVLNLINSGKAAPSRPSGTTASPRNPWASTLRRSG